MEEHSSGQPALRLGQMRRGGWRRRFRSAFFRSWWPAVLWGCLIFYLSTDTFSSEHTGTVIFAAFHWLVSSLTFEQFRPIHHLIRKSAHFTEYFVFCVLLFRGRFSILAHQEPPDLDVPKHIASPQRAE